MKKSKTKFKEGFTLIEILITIAILGVIAGVVIVKLNHSRERARDNAVFSQIKSASVAVEACLLDKGRLNNQWMWGTMFYLNGFWTNDAWPEGDICEGDSNATWPDISDSWEKSTTQYFVIRNTSTDHLKYYSVIVTNGTKNITCTRNAEGVKCIKAGF